MRSSLSYQTTSLVNLTSYNLKFCLINNYIDNFNIELDFELTLKSIKYKIRVNKDIML